MILLTSRVLSRTSFRFYTQVARAISPTRCMLLKRDASTRREGKVLGRSNAVLQAAGVTPVIAKRFRFLDEVSAATSWGSGCAVLRIARPACWGAPLLRDDAFALTEFPICKLSMPTGIVASRPKT
jgi:hypothetical protein